LFRENFGNPAIPVLDIAGNAFVEKKTLRSKRAGPGNSDSEISDSFALPTARKGHEEEHEHGKTEEAESLRHV
jgi:hypothetical protein